MSLVKKQSVDSALSITTATDWVTVEQDLKSRLNAMPYNPDLRRMLRNIGGMVTTLSKLEVVARRTHVTVGVNKQLTTINHAIRQLEGLIVWAMISS